MNKRILHNEVQEFIQDNLRSDLTKLILKGSPFEDVSIQEIAEQIQSKQKSEKKLPSWFRTEDIYFPPKLNLEQTSSEVTAKYKASLLNGRNLLDMTGGFGVDVAAFSKVFNSIVHCEKNAELSKIVKHNFEKLNISNVQCISADAIEYINESKLHFDSIYVDPSRRNDHKGKVFILEDCEPNIPKHLEQLLRYSDKILIKASPILDITSALNELNFVKEIYIVAVSNEVKELLFLIEKGYSESIQVSTINFEKKGDQHFSFQLGQKVHSDYSLPLSYLYEPNSAILKSGGFHQLSEGLKISKLQEHSHLYTSNEIMDFPGRSFKILQYLPYDKKKIKKVFSEKKANITTRNFPKSVDQIRKELKLKDGGSFYLFFTKDLNQKFTCLICQKI